MRYIPRTFKRLQTGASYARFRLCSRRSPAGALANYLPGGAVAATQTVFLAPLPVTSPVHFRVVDFDLSPFATLRGDVPGQALGLQMAALVGLGDSGCPGPAYAGPFMPAAAAVARLLWGPLECCGCGGGGGGGGQQEAPSVLSWRSLQR